MLTFNGKNVTPAIDTAPPDGPVWDCIDLVACPAPLCENTLNFKTTQLPKKTSAVLPEDAFRKRIGDFGKKQFISHFRPAGGTVTMSGGLFSQ